METRIWIGTCAVTLALAACGGEQAASAPAPAPVRTAFVAQGEVHESNEYVATVHSRSAADVRPQVSGRVVSIDVRAGDTVAAGAPLLVIDPALQEAAVDRAQAVALTAGAELDRVRATLDLHRASRRAAGARLEYARAHRDRVAELFAADATSRQAFDEATASLRGAEAELAAIDAQIAMQEAAIRSSASQVRESRSSVRQGRVALGYHRVTAPIAGRLGDIPVRVGDRVEIGALLATITGLGGSELHVEVPVERRPLLRVGGHVEILGASGDVLREASIDFVSPQVDERSQTVLVECALGDGEPTLEVGQYLRARLRWSTRTGPVVPVLAVTRLNAQAFVFVVDRTTTEPTAQQRPVRLGPIAGDRYLVLRGVEVGEEIAVEGTQLIRHGSPLSPLDDTVATAGRSGAPD
ncbi:efflux RND transporter periplasmic adaptor subunit [Sandaracinus amylolyticus]|uniref:efflux RND transporter periplasmic adaptor subunit n=1 Tax=Sandaracinus amylolyticus TaxID=927083 RepID=UPI001F258684|nr:efflux RND transporter periplasmic adaptor subunit [Sandaracinus amylolyticus]UJR83647.1 Hypothetical protein I5071_57160 [Sandaracinus amylolyticus]